MNGLLEKMLKESNWTRDDGLLPGVWDAYPDGHKSLWSCRWVIDGEIVIPSDIESAYRLPDFLVKGGKVIELTADAPRTALDFELLDAEARGEDVGIPLPGLRLNYPIFIWPWSTPPSRMVSAVSFRPGWPAPRWAHPAR